MVYEGNPRTSSRTMRRRSQLAPLRMASGGDSDDEPLLANLEFTDLMNLGDAATRRHQADLAPALAGRAAARADRCRRRTAGP